MMYKDQELYGFVVKSEYYPKATNDMQYSSSGKPEKSMYDKASVYPGDGKEYSFEEIRFKAMKNRSISLKQKTIHHQKPFSEILQPEIPQRKEVTRQQPTLSYSSIYHDYDNDGDETTRHRIANFEIINLFNNASNMNNSIHDEDITKNEVTHSRLIIPNDEDFEVYQERDEVTSSKLIIPNDEDFEVYNENETTQKSLPFLKQSYNHFNQMEDSEHDISTNSHNISYNGLSFLNDMSFNGRESISDISLNKYDFTKIDSNIDFDMTIMSNNVSPLHDLHKQKNLSIDISERPMVFSFRVNRTESNVYDPSAIHHSPNILWDQLFSTGLDKDENFFDLRMINSPELKLGDMITLGNQNYLIDRKIVEDVKTTPSFIIHDIETHIKYILKESCIYDYYISKRIQHKLKDEDRIFFIDYDSIYIFKNITYIKYKYKENVSMPLSDIVTIRNQGSDIIDEHLSIYFTMQMLKIVSALHESGFIGYKLSPDHFYVSYNDEFEGYDFRPGSPSWNCFGLYMKDYTYVIDLDCYPEGARFNSSVSKCFDEMRMNGHHLNPWKFEVDLFRVCELAHLLLYGKDIMIEYQDDIKRWKLKSKMKVFWKQEFWRDLYDLLLNAGVILSSSNALLIETKAKDNFNSLLNRNMGIILSIQSSLSKLKCL